MVAMIVPVESLSCNSFLLEADLLIHLDSRVIISNHGESEPMEPFLLRYLNRFLHHHGSQPDVLKILVEIDQHLPTPFRRSNGILNKCKCPTIFCSSRAIR